MSCKNCLIESLEYEIKIEEKYHQSILPMLLNHLARRNMESKVKGCTFFLKEEGVKEAADFCRDHLSPAMLSFRPSHLEAWRPLSEIETLLDTHWVDEVINKKLITCHFQPIVDASEEIVAYEILSRFKKEDGTPVNPNEIFSAAKLRGRLYALDKLCRMTAVGHASTIKNKKAFINFIPTSIYSPEFCLRTTVALASQLGMDPAQIVFEVVETEKVDDIEHLKAILSYYREKGFEYALDDVGEGFNTLDLLEDIVPHYMKLDIQYVQGVSADSGKQQIAKQFLHKALEIGSTPLAEGIEAREDFEWLKQAGYQLFQGYLFGKPSPFPDQREKAPLIHAR